MSNIHHYNYPSFSSSLLEEIYRSFDDNDTDSDTRSRCHSDSGYARRTKMAKTNNNNNSNNYHTNNILHPDRRDVYHGDVYHVNNIITNNNYKHVLDQWMEKEKEIDKMKIRRNSMPDDGKFRHPMKLVSSSSTSSSGSSSSTISDADSLYGTTTTKPKVVVPSLKPIRTGPTSPEFRRKSYSDQIPATGRKKGGKKEGKLQLQQRALKLYGDLKKVKQPISPGGKLASFLNSLFHNNGNNSNGKKQRTDVRDVAAKVPAVSMPSTASSYSRSCLSKTPSSAGRFERRSVRFCPVTEVYNDDFCKMEVSKTTTTDATTLAVDEEFKVQIMEKHRRVEEAAKELLKNYHSNINFNDNNNKSHYRKELKVNVVSDHSNGRFNFNCKGNNNMRGFESEDDEEEDDDESCCSSDLFELDNLLEIGVGDRYHQELPVYETTNVGTNRAIANGFIL